MLHVARISRNLLLLALATMLISACGTTRKQSLFGGKNDLGEFHVSWGHVPALDERVSDELIALAFYFSSNSPGNKTGLTEEEWIEEAARLGWKVSQVRVAYGRDAYKGPDGALRKCTISAIQRGLCGKKLGLSIEQRVQMAKQLIDANEECEWVGFDKLYHARTAFNLGAQDFTLHVPAKCSSL